METCLLLGAQQALYPQDMSAREGGVATEIDFHGRREPPEIEPIFMSKKECGLRKIHLPCDVLEPPVRRRFTEDTDRGGVSAKGT